MTKKIKQIQNKADSETINDEFYKFLVRMRKMNYGEFKVAFVVGSICYRLIQNLNRPDVYDDVMNVWDPVRFPKKFP